MSTVKVQIGGEMIVLRKASDKTCVELAFKVERKLFNKFINTFNKIKSIRRRDRYNRHRRNRRNRRQNRKSYQKNLE